MLVRARASALAQVNAALEAEVRQRTQAQAALRAAEAKFRGVLEAARDAVLIADASERIRLVNSQAERLFGYRREQVLGRHLTALLPELRRQKTRRRPGTQALELLGRRKDGSLVPVELSLSRLETPEGMLIFGDIRDISHRKLMQEALRDSQAQLRALLEHSPSMIFLKDTAGRYLHFNQRFGQVFHLDLHDAVGKKDEELFPAAQAAEFRRHDEEVIRSGRAMQFDETAVHDDGPHASIVTKFPLFDAQRKLSAIGGIVTDVTERRRLEREVLHISEREQRRIAADLHDGVAQLLSGTVYLTSLLRDRLQDQVPDEAKQLGRILKFLDEALTHTRTLAQGLHPVPPGAGGLMLALETLAAQTLQVFRLPCRLHCPWAVCVRDDVLATHLYRIGQEAVTNAVKHSRASRLDIRLTNSGDNINLAIMDNGVGMPRQLQNKRKGMGLQIMDYRSRMIGGTLIIRPTPRGGTTVVCSAPKLA